MGSFTFNSTATDSTPNSKDRYVKNVIITAKTGDSTYQCPRIDSSTHVLETIDYMHHEIHAGSNFFIDSLVSLDINQLVDVQFTTPNTTKWSHWNFLLECSAQFSWWIYETATVLTAGSVAVAYNSDRNSSVTSGNTVGIVQGNNEATTLTYTSTVGSTVIAKGRIGAGRSGGLAERENEKILKQNTTYCLRGFADAAGYVSFMMHWYEHTNKDA